MSVSFDKHRTQLLEAWEDVVNDKSSSNWALFGYEKQSNDLQVVSTGDGGLEELSEEFNSGKIMYAYCRVIDPKTELSKFVFINWQGEGAPLNRKGTCASHVADVSRFFKGAHVTVNARTEDDVEPDIIIEKVAKASASKFNFKERSDPVENIAPVGSVYKRIQPTREINPVAREKFWEKEQEQEKRRVAEEKKKAEEQRQKLEAERKEREMREVEAREKIVRERAHSITQLKEAERIAHNNKNVENEKLLWEKQLEDDAKADKERRLRSESQRRERSYEAQALISQRKINARAIFEQNTCAGQLSSVQTVRQPKVLQEFETRRRESEPAVHISTEFIRETKARSETVNDSKKANDISPTELKYTQNVVSASPQKQEPVVQPEVEEEQNWEEPSLEEPYDAYDSIKAAVSTQVIEEEPALDPVTQFISATQIGDGLRARALYDYQAADDTEISFDPGDILKQIEQIDEGWWQGLAPDGTYGLFPANYVELLD